jgi:tRNA-guanine family transglycosylase
MKLKHQEYEEDFSPIDPSCSCVCCKNYTRAFLHNVVAKNVPSAAILVSVHNVSHCSSI